MQHLTGMTQRSTDAAAAKRTPRPLARHSRWGHTLAELLLVFAILVLFAGIVMPKVASALIRSKLDAAFSAVRGDLLYSRDRSVSTGVRHQFVLDPASRDIVVQAYHPDEQTNASTGSANSNVQPDTPLKDHLPAEVRVSTWTIAPLGSDPTQTGSQFNAQGSVTPLVFYPEGQADTATLILEDQFGHKRGLQVVGFTGEIREMTPDEMK